MTSPSRQFTYPASVVEITEADGRKREVCATCGWPPALNGKCLCAWQHATAGTEEATA